MPSGRYKKNAGVKKTRYLTVLLILGIFILITVALIGQNNWKLTERVDRKLTLLDSSAFENTHVQGLEEFLEEAPAERECLYLWESGDANSSILHEQLPQILKDMKADYVEVDVDTQEIPDYREFRKLVIGIADYTNIYKMMDGLLNWVGEGGCVMIAQVPNLENVSKWMLQSAGVKAMGNSFHLTPGIRILDDVMIHGEKTDYLLEEPYESSMALALKEDCIVHIVSCDETQVPILWEYPLGDGRMVAVNFGIYDKAYRGLYSTAYSLMGDSCVYPVINSSTFYLDDFPSPVPAGESSYINRDYNMDIKSFYNQIWWEDTKALGEKYKVRYTGLVIEDYSDQVEAPFPENSGMTRFEYFGNTLLMAGGEIGFHGYNHMPLCLDGFDYMGMYDSYVTWPTYEDMKAGLTELNSFCTSLFPNEKFQVYVPPSNILSDEGRAMLLEDFPQIKAIASVYLPGGPSYSQEFEVSPDGMIETPRTISGYILDDYEWFVALSELNFHFVNTHFQHPDDVLDEDRGAELGWAAMHERLSSYMEWLYGAAPDIRNLTGSELAGAVQRFYYLEVYRKDTPEELELLLDHFQDEAWLMIRCNGWEPDTAEGGELTQLSGSLYLLKADQEHIVIKKKVI